MWFLFFACPPVYFYYVASLSAHLPAVRLPPAVSITFWELSITSDNSPPYRIALNHTRKKPKTPQRYLITFS